MSDWGRVRFRKWLVGKCLETQNLARVCCVAIYKKRIDEVAEQSGLHPSVVEEVGREYARRVVASGRPVPTGSKTSRARYPQLELKLPAEAYDAFLELADRLHMRPTTLLRSLVHEYLLGAEEPLHRDPRWVLDGKVIDGSRGKRMSPGATHGALAALTTRAARLGLTQHDLLRCLVVDALAGRRIARTPIHRAAMFEDVSRYRS